MNVNKRQRQSNNRANRLKRSLQRVYIRFIRIRGEPNNIALGFALGLFVGMSPSMGAQTVIAIFLAALLKWNKISAAIGVWITNPFTAPVIYLVTYRIGAKLLGVTKNYTPNDEPTLTIVEKMLQKAPDIFWALIVGGIIVGIPLAIIGYYFSFSAVQRYQDRIRRRIAERKEKFARKKQRKRDEAIAIERREA
ncbi:DUF2062 domain-containing protein [Thermodesulfobacteriota bacterium]